MSQIHMSQSYVSDLSGRRISLGCLIRFAAMSGAARGNALHYIVEGIGTRYEKHRNEACKASESHVDRRLIQFAQFVLKIAPNRGSKFGIGRKMLYLCTRKQEVASTSEGCGSALAKRACHTAFTLHFPCISGRRRPDVVRSKRI